MGRRASFQRLLQPTALWRTQLQNFLCCSGLGEHRCLRVVINCFCAAVENCYVRVLLRALQGLVAKNFAHCCLEHTALRLLLESKASLAAGPQGRVRLARPIPFHLVRCCCMGKQGSDHCPAAPGWLLLPAARRCALPVVLNTAEQCRAGFPYQLKVCALRSCGPPTGVLSCGGCGGGTLAAAWCAPLRRIGLGEVHPVAECCLQSACTPSSVCH